MASSSASSPLSPGDAPARDGAPARTGAPAASGDGAAAPRVLVSGATGYIGGRLVPRLLHGGYRVRCFVRDRRRLAGRPWRDRVEVAEGDALQYDTLPAALDGCHTAYYLIHSLGSGEGTFAARDRRAATNFARAAAAAGVERIIYLGGIQPKGDRQSKHLQSRMETGDHLRSGTVPVTELRAAVVVGSGSLSFELVRYLTERVPVMICPTWVRTPTQPIGIRNVLEYLVAALETPASAGEIVEIGGANVLSYGDMFQIYAKVRGLHRPIIDVPFLTPRLSSHWVGLVTPISNTIARPLIEGLDNEVTVDDPAKARRLFPDVEPMSYEAAVRLALRRTDAGEVPTVWNTALSSHPKPGHAAGMTSASETAEGLERETYQRVVRASAADAFATVERLGGQTGWLFADRLWRVRGFLDALAGGIGYRQGRRSPTELHVGDPVDFWRVDDVRRQGDRRLLRLRAEMQMPGRAWLQYEVVPETPAADGTPRARLVQTTFFEPRGLLGAVYWWLVALPHRYVFGGMARALAARIEADARTQAAPAAPDAAPSTPATTA
jgi:uncharacterized protein YbjT (DUF2867 family)